MMTKMQNAIISVIFLILSWADVYAQLVGGLKVPSSMTIPFPLSTSMENKQNFSAQQVEDTATEEVWTLKNEINERTYRRHMVEGVHLWMDEALYSHPGCNNPQHKPELSINTTGTCNPIEWDSCPLDVLSADLRIVRNSLGEDRWTRIIENKAIGDEPDGLHIYVNGSDAPFWIRDMKYPVSNVNSSNNKTQQQARGVCIHHSAAWLSAAGNSTRKLNAIEIYTFSDYMSQALNRAEILLHEVAHFVHYQCLPEGQQNKTATAIWNEKKASGDYEQVERQNRCFIKNQKKDKAYAIHDPREFFASLSVPFFNHVNDYQPFTRSEFQRFDPHSLEVLEYLWNTNHWVKTCGVSENNLF